MTLVDHAGQQVLGSTAPAPPPVLRHNDYSALEPPPVGEWSPVLGVSVVVPAFGGQEKLDLTLASLAAQGYPPSLTEVVVVDDGSAPALRLPELRPENTRLVPALPGGWGRAHAVHSGALSCGGEVLLFLDADMVVFRDHLEAQMRWHHLADYLAVTGNLRVVEDTGHPPTPREVFEAVGKGEEERLVEGPGREMEWLAKAYRTTGDLRKAGPRAHRCFIGATGSVHRAFYHESGGMDPTLLLGEDTHLGFRMLQNGAVFVPERAAGSWHLGLPHMERRRAEAMRFNRTFVGNRLPYMADSRRVRGRRWQVPGVDAVVEAEGHTFEEVAATVDALLRGDASDLRITLVGAWEPERAARSRPADGPGQDLRLIREHYGAEPRVRFAAAVPGADPDVPFRLLLAPGQVLAPHAVDRMVDRMEKSRCGLLRATVLGNDLGGPRLERTAAFARARRLAGEGEDLEAMVDRVYGVHWMDGDSELFQEAPEAPADWEEQVARALAAAEGHRARARALEGRFRRLTGGGLGRLLWRVLG
ncbi:glycosyltransferase family A protein [Nocardiopsis sp. NPDC006139]|uniref:glycosyltransferase family A protein n=1 Tax=unclassified Nocardiopsis TaxID=2649073 RepID=UPI0033BE7DE4